MFEKILSPTTRDSLERVSALDFSRAVYLAGGTALALQLGHRHSYDLDFFTQKPFDERVVTQMFAETLPGFTLERQEWRTILGFVGTIKLSLFFYSYPLLLPLKNFLGVPVADVKDIVAMKIAAIADRGSRRDFIDVYVAIQEHCISSLEEALDLYDKKFGTLSANKIHIVKSFGYFKEADEEPMPQMTHDISWDRVKEFFLAGQREIAKRILQ